MSNWVAGPELLISTKRMDSSFGKNAANRVEESYGDAKNLRLRHPLAALGFVYGLRSTIFDESPDKAEWLIDLLQKLGREDDAYHAVSLIVIEYGPHLAVDETTDDQGDGDDPLVEAGVIESDEAGVDEEEHVEQSEIDIALAARPSYIALGHVFPTQTKQMPSAPQGLAQLAAHVKRLADHPTVAIGGISLERAPAVLDTGVGSIAVVSAITQATDWQAATAQLLQLAGAGDE